MEAEGDGSDKTFRLIAADGKSVSIPLEVAKMSSTCRLAADAGMAESRAGAMHLPEMDIDTLREVSGYMSATSEGRSFKLQPENSLRTLLAAEYLGLPQLVSMATKLVALHFDALDSGFAGMSSSTARKVLRRLGPRLLLKAENDIRKEERFRDDADVKRCMEKTWAWFHPDVIKHRNMRQHAKTRRWTSKAIREKTQIRCPGRIRADALRHFLECETGRGQSKECWQETVAKVGPELDAFTLKAKIAPEDFQYLLTHLSQTSHLDLSCINVSSKESTVLAAWIEQRAVLLRSIDCTNAGITRHGICALAACIYESIIRARPPPGKTRRGGGRPQAGRGRRVVPAKMKKTMQVSAKLSDFGMGLLCKPTIIHHGILQALVISDNDIGQRGGVALSEILKRCPNLTALCFNRCNTGAAGLARIMQSRSSMLSVLSGSGNVDVASLSDDGSLHQEIKVHWQSLTSLDLGSNAMAKQCHQSLALSLATNYTLTNLSLRGTRMDDYSARRIAYACCSAVACPIRRLDVSRNGLTSAALRDFAAMISHRCSVTALDISHNDIDDEIASLIGKALSAAERPDDEHQSGLQEICMQGGRIRCAGFVRLLRGIQSSSSLTSLSCAQNDIRCHGACELAAMLPRLGLRRIHLARCRIGDQGSLALAEAMMQPGCPKIKVDLSGNPIGDTALTVLRSALIRNAAIPQES
eukprot:g402.t1